MTWAWFQRDARAEDLAKSPPEIWLSGVGLAQMEDADPSVPSVSLVPPALLVLASLQAQGSMTILNLFRNCAFV